MSSSLIDAVELLEYRILLSSIPVGVEEATDPSNIVENFDTQSSGIIHVNGSAQVADGQLALTNGVGQTGSAWFEPLLTSNHFTARFDFKISDQAGVGWGDGFTFAVIDYSSENHATGDGGSGLGYQGLSGLAVEVDTYTNSGDPSYVHVGLDVGGSVSSVQVSSELPFQITDADWITAEITFDDGAVNVSLSRPGTGLVSILDAVVPVGTLPESSRIGFTAATAAAAQKVVIDNFRLDVTTHPDEVVPYLNVGGPPALWINKSSPVTVLPHITAEGSANLEGGTLKIDVDTIGTAKRLIDRFAMDSFASFGSSSGPHLVNGQLTLQLQLNENATAAVVQNFLRGITFATKGKGLKTLTRTLHVTLTNADGLSSSVSQAIYVRTKPDRIDGIPNASQDTFTVVENSGTTSGSVAGNDLPSSDGGNWWSLVENATNGVVVVNSNGTFTYAPNAGFNGPDSFTYRITDIDGDISLGTVIIAVSPSDDVPIAVNDALTVAEDSGTTVGNMAGNDTPSSDAGNVYSLTTGASNGAVIVNSNGTFSYTPNASFNGSDSFTYSIIDVDGDTSGAVVTITVTSVDDLPVAVNDTLTVDEDSGSTTGTLATNDTASGDGGNVYTLSIGAANGIAVVNAGGSFTYLPNGDFNGVDSFFYSITDSDGDVSTATVTITVNPIDEVPVFTPAFVVDESTISEGGQLGIHVREGAPSSPISVYVTFAGAVVAFDDSFLTDANGNADVQATVPFMLLPTGQNGGDVQVIVVNSDQAQEFAIALTPGLRMTVLESEITEDNPFTVQVSGGVPNSEVVVTASYGDEDPHPIAVVQTDASGNGSFVVTMPRLINNDIPTEGFQINVTSAAANHVERIHTTLHRHIPAQLYIDETRVKEGGSITVHVRGGKGNSQVSASIIYDGKVVFIDSYRSTDANGQADFSFRIPYRLMTQAQPAGIDGIKVQLEHDGRVEMRTVELVKGLRFSVHESDVTELTAFHVEVNDSNPETLVKVKIDYDQGLESELNAINQQWDHFQTNSDGKATLTLTMPKLLHGRNEDGIKIGVWSVDRWEYFGVALHKDTTSSSGPAGFKEGVGGPAKLANPIPTLLPRVNEALAEAGAVVNDTNSHYFQVRVVKGDFTSYQQMVDAIKYNIQNHRGPFQVASPPPSEPYHETPTPPEVPPINLSPAPHDSQPHSNNDPRLIVGVLNGTLQWGPEAGRASTVSLFRYENDKFVSSESINHNITTCVLVHGKDDTSESLRALAKAVAAEDTGLQVLLLDWRSGAADNTTPYRLEGSRWIRPVGEWAAKRLADLGFAGDTLNLIGHSWGAHVANEIAEWMQVLGKGKVNSIVALDPAQLPGVLLGNAYLKNVNFSQNARFSWAFNSSGFGSNDFANTANESFDLPDGQWVYPSHNNVIAIFKTLIMLNVPVRDDVISDFDLDRLLNHGFPLSVWQVHPDYIADELGAFEVRLWTVQLDDGRWRIFEVDYDLRQTGVIQHEFLTLTDGSEPN